MIIEELAREPAASLIGRYVQLTKFIDNEEADLKLKLAPYKRALTAITGALMMKMDGEQTASLSSETHTAYFTHPERVTVIDRDVYLDWVIANRAFGLITNHVSKEGLHELELPEPPPGLAVEIARKLCVRRR